MVGADGAESVVRRALGIAPNRPQQLAIAIRGYAPVPAGLEDVQVIATTEQRWPAYAWSFPLGDGRANVGYGELVSGGVNRDGLLAGLERLLPGVGAAGLKAHRLPLSTGRPRQPDGRVLLAGDAASLINPLTGEGIFYAVLSGALAGAAAVRGRRGGCGVPRGAAPAAGPAPAALVDGVLGQPVAVGDGRRLPGGRRPTSGCSTTSSSWGWPTAG